MSYINEVHPVDRTSRSSVGYSPRPGGCTCFLTGSGPPDDRLGQTSDSYLDTDNWVIYAPKSAAGWPSGVSLQGPAGGFLYGRGAPSASVGRDGDAYLDVTPGRVQLYANKKDGTWPTPVLLTGDAGPAGPATRYVFGKGPPPAESDKIGPYDCWVDEDTSILYHQLRNEG